MSELEKNKNRIVRELHGLCAHCASGQSHNCRVQQIANEIKAISGIPLLVNNEFRGVVWQ